MQVPPSFLLLNETLLEQNLNSENEEMINPSARLRSPGSSRTRNWPKPRPVELS